MLIYFQLLQINVLYTFVIIAELALKRPWYGDQKSSAANLNKNVYRTIYDIIVPRKRNPADAVFREYSEAVRVYIWLRWM